MASIETDTAASSRSGADALEDLPGARRDLLPGILLLILMTLALPLVGDVSTWGTLTVAALAMGMMLFIMATGLTLIFGLMDVMNLGHAAFVTVGAYTATLLVEPLKMLLSSASLWAALAAIAIVVVAAMAVTAVLGWVFELLFVRPVYGDHLKQILITIGAMIIIQQLVLVLFGVGQMSLSLPEALRGSLALAQVSVERFRLVAVAVGLAVFVGLTLMLNRTRIGLLIRAGVENRQMVEALGYRIRRIFVAVFVGASALAGLGGAMWGFYREQFAVSIGNDVAVQMFIIVIIGGLGSVAGCFAGALLISLCATYLGFLAPDLALVSDIVVMMCVLLWRPRGLYPVNRS